MFFLLYFHFLHTACSLLTLFYSFRLSSLALPVLQLRYVRYYVVPISCFYFFSFPHISFISFHSLLIYFVLQLLGPLVNWFFSAIKVCFILYIFLFSLITFHSLLTFPISFFSSFHPLLFLTFFSSPVSFFTFFSSSSF